MQKPAKKAAHAKKHKRHLKPKKAKQAKRKKAQKVHHPHLTLKQQAAAAHHKHKGHAKAAAGVVSGEAYAPDALDPRDHIYVARDNSPAFVDLAPTMPPITDQADDTCIAHAVRALADHAGYTMNVDVISGRPQEIRQVIRQVNGPRYLAVKPQDIQAALNDGLPMAFGVTLFDCVTTDHAMTTGVVTLPTPHDPIVGPHCMVAVGIGYGHEWIADGQFPHAIPSRRYVKVRNSWGVDVYKQGHLLMPYAYLTQHAKDIWVLPR